MIKITAIIVTYNRLEKLKKNIRALLEQKYVPSTILIVDNNSSDGTQSFLEELKNRNELVHVCRLAENVGGAGGFSYGIKFAAKNFSDDYFWLMDDDTIPQENCLAELVKTVVFLNGKFGFLCSDVRWTDGEPALMNVPMPTRDWNYYENSDVIKLKYATFVSVLLSRKVVNKVGLPYSDFFIWGDDVEYTTYISRQFESYYVKSSVVIHEMANNSAPDILNTPEDRISRFYYDFRNRFVIERENRGSVKGNLKATVYSLNYLLKVVLKRKGLKKAKVIIKGSIDGFFFHPIRKYIR